MKKTRLQKSHATVPLSGFILTNKKLKLVKFGYETKLIISKQHKDPDPAK